MRVNSYVFAAFLNGLFTISSQQILHSLPLCLLCYDSMHNETCIMYHLFYHIQSVHLHMSIVLKCFVKSTQNSWFEKVKILE